MGIQIYFKGGNTNRNLPVPLHKDKETTTQKIGVIYKHKCDRVEWYEKYIGKSASIFWEAIKEHLRGPSSIYEHANITDHQTMWIT